MWQRIQSVFLGLSVLSLLAAFFMPIWEGQLNGDVFRLYPIYFMTKLKGATGNELNADYYPFCVTAFLLAAAITIAIQSFRRYDNRMLQIKLGMLNSLVIAAIMICAILFSNLVTKEKPGVVWRYDLSLYLTFAATVFNWLAMRFIRRDEKLVRDSDRLR